MAKLSQSPSFKIDSNEPKFNGVFEETRFTLGGQTLYRGYLSNVIKAFSSTEPLSPGVDVDCLLVTQAVKDSDAWDITDPNAMFIPGMKVDFNPTLGEGVYDATTRREYGINQNKARKEDNQKNNEANLATMRERIKEKLAQKNAGSAQQQQTPPANTPPAEEKPTKPNVVGAAVK